MRSCLLLSQGRSGSKFLLRLINQSTETFCRNEPDRLANGELAWWRDDAAWDEADVGSGWDASIAAAASRFGTLDSPLVGSKDWLAGHARPFASSYLRAWRAIARRGGAPDRERRLPAWMANRERKARALHCFKVNALPRVACWMLEERSATPLVHVVRHPGGYLSSWSRRYANARDPETLRASNLARLEALAARSSEWRGRLGELRDRTAVEAELMYWAYCNEVVFRAGRSLPSYQLVVYEELVTDPSAVCERVFAHLGLSYDEARVLRGARPADEARRIASAWRSELDAGTRSLVERVLSQGALAGVWGSRD